MYRISALALLLGLAACGSPEEQCLRKATPDYSAIDTKIADSEASIARGYRVDSSSRVTVGFDMCNRSGNVSLCVGGDKVLPQRQVPIDVQTEKARLADLRAKRAEMVALSERRMAACRAGA